MKNNSSIATYAGDVLYDFLSEREMTLQEPHGNDMEGQWHNVVVKFEWVSVGDGDGKDKHVLSQDEAGVQMREVKQCWRETSHNYVVKQTTNHNIFNTCYVKLNTSYMLHCTILNFYSSSWGKFLNLYQTSYYAC